MARPGRVFALFGALERKEPTNERRTCPRADYPGSAGGVPDRTAAVTLQLRARLDLVAKAVAEHGEDAALALWHHLFGPDLPGREKGSDMVPTLRWHCTGPEKLS